MLSLRLYWASDLSNLINMQDDFSVLHDYNFTHTLFYIDPFYTVSEKQGPNI